MAQPKPVLKRTPWKNAPKRGRADTLSALDGASITIRSWIDENGKLVVVLMGYRGATVATPNKVLIRASQVDR